MGKLRALYDETAHRLKANTKHAERVTDPWYGFSEVSLDHLAEEMRRTITRVYLRPERHHRVIGFKEVRHGGEIKFDVLGHCRFLRTVFPGSRIVFSSRDPAATAKSGFWRNNKNAEEQIVRIDKAMHEAYRGVEDAFWLDYETMTCKDGLRDMFGWLGETYESARIEQVLGRQHSNEPRSPYARRGA